MNFLSLFQDCPTPWKWQMGDGEGARQEVDIRDAKGRFILYLNSDDLNNGLVDRCAFAELIVKTVNELPWKLKQQSLPIEEVK